MTDEELSIYSGDYRHVDSRDVTLKLEIEGGKLRMSFPNTPGSNDGVLVVPVGKHFFKQQAYKTTIEFAVEDGKVARLFIRVGDQGQLDQRYIKVK